jgi:hypothetical protein
VPVAFDSQQGCHAGHYMLTVAPSFSQGDGMNNALCKLYVRRTQEKETSPLLCRQITL